MSDAMYVPPEEREGPDPSRRRYFQEYMDRPELARLGVTYGDYADEREAGTWNETAEQHWPGDDRFKVYDNGGS